MSLSKVDTIWNNFFKNIMIDTFNEFLTMEQINERATWMLSQYRKIKPHLLFKNIVFMLNNNAVSEMAIGYKLHFLIDDYKTLFINPYSEEFDRNDTLIESDKELLNKIIDNFCIVINHHIEKNLNENDTNIPLDLSEVVKELSNFLNIPKYETCNEMYINCGDLIYRMSFGQILYMVAFNQNPFNGETCPNEVSNIIEDNHRHRLDAMRSLKRTWETGIPLRYVQSNNIF